MVEITEAQLASRRYHVTFVNAQPESPPEAKPDQGDDENEPEDKARFAA
jgi:hypothetical protein